MWVTLKSCSIYFSLSLIVCEQHWRFWWRAVSSCLSYYQQGVSGIVHFMKGSLITSFPITNSQWVVFHILWKGSLIFSYDQQAVSDIAYFVKGSLMTLITSSLLWPIACEWHCTFWRQSHHIFSCDQQGVSDTAHFVKGSFITSFL